MKPTGKINPITGEQMFRAEPQDIVFWDEAWEDLTLEQKAIFCSYIEAPFLGPQNEDVVKHKFEIFKSTKIS